MVRHTSKTADVDISGRLTNIIDTIVASHLKRQDRLQLRKTAMDLTTKMSTHPNPSTRSPVTYT